MQEMSGDRIPSAFSEVLSEFSNARETIVGALTRAADMGDYDAVTELTERLKRADAMKNEVERLQEEWQAVFQPETIDAELLEHPPYGSHTAFGVPDQYDLCSPTATNNFGMNALDLLRRWFGNKEFLVSEMTDSQVDALAESLSIRPPELRSKVGRRLSNRRLECELSSGKVLRLVVVRPADGGIPAVYQLQEP